MKKHKKRKKDKAVKIADIIKSLNREVKAKEGVFDGRYATKAIPDKKKKASKRACRKKINPSHAKDEA